ncbi:uncharacterized protein ACA1_096340 [Acanthamoeba castellanii str. Neff]|uniref:Uncharacterized protein n=1 Tax=Acanthamoeba castellanii (strain ATCC 30010 / Neff) TaxID=1257118 RepID=L8GJQ6_ACACF|nr:uncharacterized protein ACA1_096340 [Acanthamoeba castellanii str. Neff]ELR12963.1 hypothetical protein ACA1_096340 [Acanthamoeba castellanii str. Neff]
MRRCAAKLADCKDACQNFEADPSTCLTCIGDGADACCPCFQKVFGPSFPCDQPTASSAPSSAPSTRKA